MPIYQIGPKRLVVGAHYGLKEWIIQRITAIVMVVFTVVLLILTSYGQIVKSTTGGTAAQIPVYITDTASMGVIINAWLGFFNLIPFGSFDGQKVFQWNKKVWGIFFGASIVLFVLIFFA